MICSELSLKSSDIYLFQRKNPIPGSNYDNPALSFECSSVLSLPRGVDADKGEPQRRSLSSVLQHGLGGNGMDGAVGGTGGWRVRVDEFSGIGGCGGA